MDPSMSLLFGSRDRRTFTGWLVNLDRDFFSSIRRFDFLVVDFHRVNSLDEFVFSIRELYRVTHRELLVQSNHRHRRLIEIVNHLAQLHMPSMRLMLFRRAYLDLL